MSPTAATTSPWSPEPAAGACYSHAPWRKHDPNPSAPAPAPQARAPSCACITCRWCPGGWAGQPAATRHSLPHPLQHPRQGGEPEAHPGMVFPGWGGGTAGSQLPCLSQAQGSWGPRPSPRPVPRPAAPPEQGRTWHDFLSPLRRDWMETGRLLSGQSYSGPRMWDGGKKFSWTGCLCQRLPAPSVDKGRH